MRTGFKNTYLTENTSCAIQTEIVYMFLSTEVNICVLSNSSIKMIAHAELKKQNLGFNIPSKTIFSNLFYLLISTYK